MAPEAPNRLAFYLLNREEVWFDGSALPPIRMRKANALLFFLIAAYEFYGRNDLRREYLASLFWPDQDRQRGLTVLRQVFYRIRKSLKAAGAPDFFRADRKQIGIQPERAPWCDLRVLHRGNPFELMDLPPERIEPLPGLVFYEEEELADWLAGLRAAVQREAVRALSKALDHARKSRQWEAVESLAVRYLAQWEEPEQRACEAAAEACFFQDRKAEARTWLAGIGLQDREIETWMREKGRQNAPASAVRLGVLPLGEKGNSRSLSRGLMEDLIAELSAFDQFELVSSLSGMAFLDRGLTVRDIADRLAVEYLIYGTIRQDREAVRISIQLIQVAPERVIWSKIHRGRIDDLYTIQQNVVRDVLEGLNQKLALLFPPPSASIPDPEAFQLYLQGWSIYFRGNPESTTEAKACFERSVRIAPDFHRAHLGLATILSSLASWWGDQRVSDVEDAFFQALHKAAEDSQLRFEISGILGWFRMWQWDLAAAEREFQHAMLKPTDTSFCFSGYTHLLMVQGRFEEAFRIADLGMRENPNHVLHRSMLSELCLLTGKLEESERICKAILLQMPDKHSTMTDLIWCLIRAGRPGEAIALGEAFLERTGRRLYFVLGRLALAYLAAGHRQEGDRIYAEMEAASQRGQKGHPYYMALYQQVIGQTDRALDLLERYLPDRSSDYLWLRVQPEFKPLHGHPRFDALVHAVFGKQSV